MNAVHNKSGFFLFLSIVLVFPALLIASITIFNSKPEMQKLKSNAQEATASVIFKKQETASCGDSTCTVYILSLIYFDNPDGEYRIIELAPGVVAKLPTAETGDSHSASLEVPKRFFRNTNAGDRIKILYLENNYDKVWLAKTVQSWNIWFGGLWLSCTLLILAIVFFYFSLLFRRRKQKSWLELGLE